MLAAFVNRKIVAPSISCTPLESHTLMACCAQLRLVQPQAGQADMDRHESYVLPGPGHSKHIGYVYHSYQRYGESGLPRTAYMMSTASAASQELLSATHMHCFALNATAGAAAFSKRLLCAVAACGAWAEAIPAAQTQVGQLSAAQP